MRGISTLALALLMITTSCAESTTDASEEPNGPDTSNGTGPNATGTDSDAGGGTTSPDGEPPAPQNAPLADGLSIDEIALYQVLKIDLVAKGKAVTPALPIVAGREALVRVFVQTADTWSPRPITARLTLTTKGKEQTFEDSRTVTDASTDAKIASTFSFKVDAANVGSDTTWKVELLDLAAGAKAGDPTSARWPHEDGSTASLGAKNVGNLKLRLIPIKLSNNLVSEVSAAATDIYREHVRRLYPVPDVEISVGSTYAYSGAIPQANGAGWDNLLNALTNKHKADNAAGDVYYVGLFRPGSSQATFCKSACVAGLGNRVEDQYASAIPEFRTAIVAAFTASDAPGVADSLAHEVGHNHGRQHSPCEMPASDVDPGFPDKNGGIGTWGYDSTDGSLYDPMVNAKYSLTSQSNPPRDIMSYCGMSYWVSGYTYKSLYNRSVLINTWKPTTSSMPATRYRELHVRADGSVDVGESVERQGLASLERPIDIVDVRGQARSEKGIFVPYDHLPGGTLLVPEDVSKAFVGARLSSVATSSN